MKHVLHVLLLLGSVCAFRLTLLDKESREKLAYDVRLPAGP